LFPYSPWSRLLFFFILPFLAEPGAAQANLRAPIMIPKPPSSALLPAGDRLAVAREELRLTCGPERCRVEATYHLEVAEALEVELEFALPSPSPITVLLGDAPTPSQAVQAGLPVPAGEQPERGPGPPWGDTYRARFRVCLAQGAAVIKVAYDQELAAFETDYGYFKDGRFVRHLEYLLWPLKEWRRLPGFRIDLTVSLPREPPSAWARTFGDPFAFRCVGDDRPGRDEHGQRVAGRRAFLPAPQQQGGQLVLQARLDQAGDFAHTLTCFFADADLLPAPPGEE